MPNRQDSLGGQTKKGPQRLTKSLAPAQVQDRTRKQAQAQKPAQSKNP